MKNFCGFYPVTASHIKNMTMRKNLNLYLLQAYNASARFTQEKIFITISLLSLLFVLISAAASAQTQNISGVVRDDERQALVGVSVSVKGTTQGVLTDEKGQFNISVDLSKNSVLIFSYIGKKGTELTLEKGKAVDLTMYDDPSYFTDLVVTGEATADQLYTEKKSGRNNARKKSKRLF